MRGENPRVQKKKYNSSFAHAGAAAEHCEILIVGKYTQEQQASGAVQARGDSSARAIFIRILLSQFFFSQVNNDSVGCDESRYSASEERARAIFSW